MSIASLRPIDCGGCKGLGAHTRRCPTQPGWRWFQLQDLAESLGDGIGANDTKLANMAYQIAGAMKAKAEEKIREASDCDHFRECGKHYWSMPGGIYEPWICLSCNRKKSDIENGVYPWPGYCQACKAALDPPNATWCASCGADDTDDLG